ncbi:hypothetical protein HID58_009849 [Brassica napus]|uniref:Uncharacterized protein n=1 Tax=Brassica napus TaxID=3708 RepID=A0ABQ8DTM7_BRANA|nr:hypothetical protein HID58_009849 [Brassica napus]
MKEKDFIISVQKKNLKATKDNVSLHQKNWSLSADNRKVVDNYQAELSEQISSLFNMVASCLSQQNAHLQGINKLSQSRLEAHNKAVLEMKKKVQASRDLYSFHLEAVQNIVRLHKANSNACLEEFLASGDETTSSLFDELHNALTSHQGEMLSLQGN